VPSNPVAGNNGFLVVIQNNATLNDNETESSVALGGNLTMNGNYRVALNSAGGFTAPGDNRPTGLLIGGMINFAGSTGKVTVNQSAYVHVGNFSNGQQVVNGVTYLIPTGGSTASNPQIQLQTIQTTGAQAANLFDFTTAFTNYRDRSTSLGLCPATVTLRDQNGQGPWPGVGPATIQLVANQQNVLNLTAAQLALLTNINVNGGQPNATTPLLINVDTSAVGNVFAWTPGPFFNGGTARYIFWNFPTATSINIVGSNTIEGTVFAPRATITDLNSGTSRAT
jgi:choice-of-anchor A domain-containing protein